MATERRHKSHSEGGSPTTWNPELGKWISRNEMQSEASSERGKEDGEFSVNDKGEHCWWDAEACEWIFRHDMKQATNRFRNLLLSRGWLDVNEAAGSNTKEKNEDKDNMQSSAQSKDRVDKDEHFAGAQNVHGTKHGSNKHQKRNEDSSGVMGTKKHMGKDAHAAEIDLKAENEQLKEEVKRQKHAIEGLEAELLTYVEQFGAMKLRTPYSH